MSAPRPRGRLWIVDGHNVVYAVRRLADLQETGRGREAREALAERCRRFASRRGHRVVLVFDGDDRLPVHSGARTETRLRVVYASGTDADTRVIHEAERAVERGETVTVVTDDRRLRPGLPRGVANEDVAAFWRRSAPPASGEAKPEVEAPDIEAHFLAADAPPDTPAPKRRGGPARPGLAERRKAAQTAAPAKRVPPPARGAGDDAPAAGASIGERAGAALPRGRAPERAPVDPEAERLRKKERGLRKHAKRLERARTGAKRPKR